MADFTFLYPLWLLALVPLLALLPWLKIQSTKTKLIAPHLNKLLASKKAQSKNNMMLVIAAAWVLTVIALAAPSFKKQNIPSFSLNGARVLIMDMSVSMYAKDIQPSRLQLAKYKALDMLPSWQEGSTALVAYAAQGYVVSPLTQDANTLSTLIPELSPDIMPMAGDNLVEGVKEAIRLLSQAGYVAGDLVIIADEITDQEADEIIAIVANKQFRLSILAIASKQGAPIPLTNGQLLTVNGNTVISKLNLSAMAKITQATGGVLQHWQTSNSDIENIVALTEMPISFAAQAKNNTLLERVNQGFWLIIPVMIFALLGFRRGVILSSTLLIFPTFESYAAFKTADQLAFEQYQSEQYEQAATQFSSKKWQGVSHYKAGNFQASIESLLEQSDSTSSYNLANAYAQSGEYQKALNIYEKLIEENPQHKDAKYNLEIVKEALKQQQAQEKQEQNKQESEQNPSSSEEAASESQKQQQGEQQKSDTQPEPQQSQNSMEPNSSQKDSNADQSNNKDAEQQEKPAQDAAEEKEQATDNEKGNSEKIEEMHGLSESHPTLKKLEQVPNDTAALIRAQLILQAREKKIPSALSQQNW